MARYQVPSKPSYGNCDTFFVESDRCGFGQEGISPRSRVQQAAREKARAAAQERQLAIAGELSKLTAQHYQDDILSHMEAMEAETLPNELCIDIQTEIQWFMRPYLLDFLIEAHAAFGLLPDTLFLAINLLDRYCSHRVVYKRHYQLVGCSSLLIAAKYGDRKDRVPSIKELNSMCCSLYEDEMFTQMEWHVLQTLDWMVGHPTVDSFLQIALAEASYDPEVEHMSWYLCELALYHRDFVSKRPSVMARTSMNLAKYLLNKPSPLTVPGWCDRRDLRWSENYDPCLAKDLYGLLHEPSNVVAKKYASAYLSSASSKARAFLERQAELERARAICPPTPPMEVDSFNGHSTSLVNPQTPQKTNSCSVINGLYTPPITPESSQNHMVNYAKHAAALPPVCPATPSPLMTTQPHSMHVDQVYQQPRMQDQMCYAW